MKERNFKIFKVKSNFNSLRISQKYISIFASGFSINNLSKNDFKYIKQNSFVIGTNYYLLYDTPHLLFFSDSSVYSFVRDYFTKHKKDFLIATRPEAFDEDNKASLKSLVDYWFSVSDYKLKGNFTAFWVLQLIKKFYPDKIILLFGFDFTLSDGDTNLKCYDTLSDWDRNHRSPKTANNYPKTLDFFKEKLEKYVCDNPSFVSNTYNCNPDSRVNCFKKVNFYNILSDIKSMNIVHLTNTAMAGSPVHLSNVIKRYSEHMSISVLGNKFNKPGLKNLDWDYDYVSPDSEKLKQIISSSDILHFHNVPTYQGMTFKNPSVITLQSQPEHHPGGYTPNKTYPEFNGRKMVVAQYHPRYYADAEIVPNVIDIWDNIYKKDPNEKITIFFGYASESSGWGRKGTKEVVEVLNKFRGECNIYTCTNLPYKDLIDLKKRSHIMIGDCVTGSYHLSELEGAAIGLVVLNHCDHLTKQFMKQVSGVDSTPFQETKIEDLEKNIRFYIDNKNIMKAVQEDNRKWMEKYWNPKSLVNIYIDLYKKTLEGEKW